MSEQRMVRLQILVLKRKAKIRHLQRYGRRNLADQAILGPKKFAEKQLRKMKREKAEKQQLTLL